MNQNALLIAVAGGLAVWWLWRRQGGGQVQTMTLQPVQTAQGTWQYPAGSMPGPSPETYTDPTGAVLFKPTYEGPIDWT